MKYNPNPQRFKSIVDVTKNRAPDGVFECEDGFHIAVEIKYSDTRSKIANDHLDQILTYLIGYPNSEGIFFLIGHFQDEPFTDEQIKTAVDEALGEPEQKTVKTAVDKPETEAEKLIQKREVLSVLNRTSDDADFWNDLMDNGSDALGGYRLSNEAKAAIISGDLKWINENIGELTQKQLMFIYKRLEREAW